MGRNACAVCPNLEEAEELSFFRPEGQERLWAAGAVGLSDRFIWRRL